MDASLRLLRIIQLALLVSVVFYIAIAEKVGPQVPKDVKQMQMILMALAVGVVGTIFIFRQRMLTHAEEALRSQPEDVVALACWRAGNIITLVLAEAVVLYGLVLRFMGGTLLQAAPFYAAGALLMVVWGPRRPE